MNEMAKQMAKYFKEKPEYKRLLNGIKSKYINFRFFHKPYQRLQTKPNSVQISSVNSLPSLPARESK